MEKEITNDTEEQFTPTVESLDFLLSTLGIKKSGVIDEYIEKVANKKLRIYQDIIQTSGDENRKSIKEGQSLYIHVLNCIFTVESISSILNLTDEEKQVIYIVLTLHDINKLPHSPRKLGYKHIAVIENIEQEILRLGLDEFMPDWQDYIEDIKLLMHGHSGHTSLRGDRFYRVEDKTKLGKDRIGELQNIVTAADTADLSKNFIEKAKKNEFLDYINFDSDNQYKFISHRITEQRGLLTNLLHKNTSDFLNLKFNAIPVFNYPEGTYYLVKSTTELKLDDDDKKELGLKVKNNLDQIKSGKFEDYIGKDQKQGIKVEPEVLKLASIDSIMNVINSIILKKKYNVINKETECKEKLKGKLAKANEIEKLKYETLINQDNLFGESQDGMQKAELIRTFYIFLSKHLNDKLVKVNKSYKDTWVYVYEVLNIPQDKIDLYTVTDPLYQRSYILVQDVSDNYEDLFDKFKQILNELMEENIDKSSNVEESNEIVEYVSSNITFDFDTNNKHNFQKNLLNYYKNNHKQCSFCNSAFKAVEMMSGNVADGIKVQQFSNRLRGGPGKPKRNICPICKEQFSIEKLNFIASGEKPLYLHLMPHSFMPDVFLKSFRQTFKNILEFDISSATINIKDTLEMFKQNQELTIKLTKTKFSGIALPKHPDEVIGNTIIFPLNFLNANNTERYLKAVDYALIINKYFNFKIVVTESSIPIFGKDEFDEIFFDGLPSNLRGYINKQNFDKDQLESFWDKYVALRSIADTLTRPKDNPYVEIAQGLVKGQEYIFSIVDRLIEKKSTNNPQSLSLSKRLYESVEAFIN